MLKCANALDILPTISPNTIDLLLTDPPYNATDLKMDKQSFSILDYLDQFKRILKPNGWFFCFGTIEMCCNILQSKIFKRKFEYIWEKYAPIPKTHNTIRPYNIHEIIFAFVDPKCKPTNLYFDSVALRTTAAPYIRNRINTKPTEYLTSNRLIVENYTKINAGYREGVSIIKYPQKNRMKMSERTKHPTQKPLELIKLICQGYCPQNGIILDPFMGSGTTPLAAEITNRKYIGIEMDKNYFKMANLRISSASNQFI